MHWINFIHLYQPINQQKDIVEAVVKQSYLPIFRGINSLDNISVSMNITGSLLELFVRDGHTELLDLIRSTVKAGKVELTGSARYHTFLPLVPEKEIKRQIIQNTQVISEILGFSFSPKGFFPPEMGYHPKIDHILQEIGFEWIILDEIAGLEGSNYPSSQYLYTLNDTNIKVFFRNRRVSNLIMSAVARDTDTIKHALGEEFTKTYLVTGMDGETFGHHRLGLDKLFVKILKDKSLGTCSANHFLSNLKEGELPTRKIQANPSTWASSIQDIEKGVQFISWKDPQNTIHAKQWEFLDFALDLTYKYPTSQSNYEEVRSKMDKALASDHFWWASAKPWWSLEMIEDGAYMLLNVVESMQEIDSATVYKAYEFYMAIVSQAASWQRKGVVREMAREQNEILRIPFKERTLGKGGSEEGVYHAFIDMMTKQEGVAAKKGDYEKAILWRDAVIKLESKQDIYDTINVIDLLRIDVGNGPMEETIQKYKDKYRRLRGGQPEQRGA